MNGQEAASAKLRRIDQNTGTRRQYINRSGKSGHVSPAIVEKYLGGMHYPAEKRNLVDNAQNKGAPSDVMDLISKFPERTYNSPIDITKEIGKIE
jgi:hypothetical protein